MQATPGAVVDDNENYAVFAEAFRPYPGSSPTGYDTWGWRASGC